jgi:hypothetical protein
MKRIVVWVDSADKDINQVEKQIKDYLNKTGVKHTIFDASEIIECENE